MTRKALGNPKCEYLTNRIDKMQEDINNLRCLQDSLILKLERLQNKCEHLFDDSRKCCICGYDPYL